MDKYELDMVGTDVEFFLRDATTNEPVPVCGLIGGTKHHPQPIPELGEGFCVQEDNVMVEYNVPPAKTVTQFVNNIGKMNSYLTGLVKQKNLIPDIRPSMQFKSLQLQSQQAQTIGCEPDWNVWKRLTNPSPKSNPLMLEWRTSGGHVHISFTVNGEYTDDIFLKEPLVKVLDFTLGIPSFFLDTDPIRTQLYGTLGAFRDVAPGRIEYRTLSNFWSKTPERTAWVFNGVTEAFRILNDGHAMERFSSNESVFNKFTHYLKSTPQDTRNWLRTIVKQFHLESQYAGITL